MGKTPEYTKKAVNNYRDKFDFIQVRFPKGTRERLETKGNINDYISSLVLNGLDGVTQLEIPAELLERVVAFDDDVRGYITQAVIERLEADEELAEELEREEQSENDRTEELKELQAIIDAKKAEQDKKENERRQKEEARKRKEETQIDPEEAARKAEEDRQYLLSLRKAELDKLNADIERAQGKKMDFKEIKAIGNKTQC